MSFARDARFKLSRKGLIGAGLMTLVRRPAAFTPVRYDSRTSLHSQSSAHPLSSGDSTT